MTIIEFIDKDSIENIAGALLCEPERMILVGDNEKQANQSKVLYEKILRKKGIKTEILVETALKNYLQDIVGKLSEIVRTYGDCVFDLTGGEDLYLVAVGIVMERYEGQVQCHRFNFRNDSLYDCDADGKVCSVKTFDISIEDCINIYGGEIVTDPTREQYTYPWDLHEDFMRDVEVMWDICREKPRAWNKQMNTIGAVCEWIEQADPLWVTFEQDRAAEVLSANGENYWMAPGILYALQRRGLIHSLTIQDTVSFGFKNEQVKRCLTVAGQVLELMIAGRMRLFTDKNGAPLYHDVRVGIVMDWDGDDETDDYRTINEIDVIAMKGVIPVFISCKNGYFDVNELYKLNTVAQRFGGKYAKKVLIATEMDKLGMAADYLDARMKDMNIRLVDDVDNLSDETLDRKLKSLWSN